MSEHQIQFINIPIATITSEIPIENENNYSYLRDICKLFSNCCFPIIKQCNNECKFISDTCSCISINSLFPQACYEENNDSFFSHKCCYISHGFYFTTHIGDTNVSDVYCYMKDRFNLIKCVIPCLFCLEGSI